MIAATLGYLAGKAQIEHKTFYFCSAIQGDFYRTGYFDVTPELSRMFHIYDLVGEYRLDTEEQIQAFVKRLSFLKRASEYLPFYLLPIAYSPTKDCLTNVIQTAYEAAKSLTDDERIIRDSVLAVAVLRWSMKKLGNASDYLERLTGMEFSDLMRAKDKILKSILIGCNPHFIGYNVPSYPSAISKAIVLAVRNGRLSPVCAAIVAELAEYNHEEGGYHRMVEQLTGSYTEYSKEDIGAMEYPLTDKVQYQTKEGMTLEGYKRMDGYYGWHVQCHSFDFCLLGTKEKPFDKELVYWKWFERNWNPQTVMQAANDFLAEFHFTVSNDTNFRLDWFNKQIKIPFKGNELAVDFWNLKFDLDISLNAFVMEADMLEHENEEMNALEYENEETETMSEENGLDDELSMPLNCIPTIDSYFAIQRYGRMTWNEEQLNEAIKKYL